MPSVISAGAGTASRVRARVGRHAVMAWSPATWATCGRASRCGAAATTPGAGFGELDAAGIEAGEAAALGEAAGVGVTGAGAGGCGAGVGIAAGCGGAGADTAGEGWWTAGAGDFAGCGAGRGGGSRRGGRFGMTAATLWPQVASAGSVPTVRSPTTTAKLRSKWRPTCCAVHDSTAVAASSLGFLMSTFLAS